MKRKFLSTLLFGALACTTLSTVTSCKDYDDDISANAQEISSLKTTVSNLQTALDQAKADATAALANYATKTELGNVSNSVSALQDAVAKLVTADQLQKALDEAKAALETKASQEDLDKVSQTVAAINADLDAIKTWQKTTDSAIETANKNIEAQKEVLDELKKALEGKSSTEDLNALAKVVEGKADAEALSALQKKVEAIENAGYDLDELGKTFATVTSLNELKKAMNDADAELTKKIGAQANILAVLVNKRLSSLVFKPAYMIDGVEADVLPALVNPYIYVFKNDKTLGTDKEAIDEKKSDNQEDLSIYPEYNIYYHFNPSSSDLTGYAVSFFNNEPTKVTTTRAEGVNTNLKPAVSEIDNTYKTTTLGVVKIPVANSKETWKAMSDIDAAGKLPMVALQAAKGDTIVTSDYAQIVPVNYSNLMLVDTEKHGDTYCQTAEDTYHLSTNIANVKGWGSQTYYCHEVMYNDHNIDLTKFIDTHVFLQNADKKKVWNETEVTDSMLNVLGLSYKFHAISYTLNGDAVSEKTDQSIHLKVEENGKASVMEVDENGKVVGPNEKKGAVGRLPIVRVTLEDAAGNIYAYGYIKVKIVEEIATPQDVDVTFTETVNANCADNSISLTWAQAESKILNALNISHETFLNRYWNYRWDSQFVKNADGTFSSVKENNKKIIEAILKAQSDGSTTLTTADAMLAEFYAQGGVGYIEATAPAVSNGKTDAAGTFQNATNAWGSAELPHNYNGANTSIATWTFTTKDYSTLAKLNGFVDPATGKSLKPVKTYIRLGNSDAEGGTLYVGLNLPVGGMQFAAGTLGKHLNNKWYATASNAEGNDEIHANVVVPTADPATGSVDKFEYNILSTFQGGKVSVDYAKGIKADDFTAFNTYASNYKFYFDAEKYDVYPGDNKTLDKAKVIVNGASGATYAIFVNTTANQLYAVKGEYNQTAKKVEYKTTSSNNNVQIIVNLSGDNNATAKFIRLNVYAQDILNYAGHKDLANTFGAYIKMKNDADVCYDPFINGSDEFVVRFLRPINATQGKGATAIDAVDGGSNINVMDMIALDDWRDYGITYADNVTGSKKMHPSYIGYYGITVTYDSKNARTDENLTDAERVELTDVASIEKLGIVKDVDPNIALTDGDTFTPSYVEPVYEEGKLVKAGYWTGATLNYKNNTTTARKFHIYLPITVKYNFGNLEGGEIATFYGVITVNPTVQNAKKH